MANIDAAFGLRPVRYASGAPYNGACNPYYVRSDYATALFVGDPVLVTGDGSSATVSVPGSGTYGLGELSEVNVGAAAGAFSGSIVSVGVDPDSTGRTHLPASTGGVVMVADDPNLVFEIQEVSGGTALTAAAVGLNADFVAGTGNAYTGRSAYELNNVGEATTSSLNLKILNLSRRPGNAIGEHAVWDVMANSHTNAHGDGSTGIS